MDRLHFARRRRGIVTRVNGRDLARSRAGLTHEEARVAARLLQGWVLSDDAASAQLGVEPIGSPLWSDGRLGVFRGRALRRIVVELPGGDSPLIDRADVWDFRARVAVAGCTCSAGVACGSLSVSVSFTRESVRWSLPDRELEFARDQYDDAIRRLLRSLGEAPDLIPSQSWELPTPFRVEPVPSRG